MILRFSEQLRPLPQLLFVSFFLFFILVAPLLHRLCFAIFFIRVWFVNFIVFNFQAANPKNLFACSKLTRK